MWYIYSALATVILFSAWDKSHDLSANSQKFEQMEWTSIWKKHVMKDHEKSTTFHCEQCSRSFGTSTYLKSHIRQVHERLKCDECGQEMCNTFILKRHKAKVHGVKNANEHQCKHCHLCFKLKNALTKHIAKIHPDVKFHE